MKVDIKIICLVLITLCLVAENDGWLWGKRSSSRISTRRSSSRTSTRSSSSSSRRYSRRTRSSRRRKGWLFWGNRGPARAKPTVASRRTQLPYNHQSSSSWRKCTWHYGIGCIQPAPKTTKAPATNPIIDSAVTAIKKMLKSGKTCLPGAIWLLMDIFYCSEKDKLDLPKPSLRRVFPKKVVKVQIVERPLLHCLPGKNKKYRPTISCLQFNGVKTSISGKKGKITHSGVVVETKDKKKYFIHKGDWNKRQTTKIEVSKDSMFDKGYTKIGRNIKPKKLWKVRKYYKKSGSGYNFVNDNCHDGTLRMVNLAKKS